MAKNLNPALGFSFAEEKMNSEKILILDHVDGFQCKTESDSFFISVAGLANGSHEEDSKTTRSIGRNGFLRSSLEKITSRIIPGGFQCLNQPEKSSASAVGQSNQKFHHQIAITAGNMNNQISRRNSSKRSPLKFILKPRNIAIFFATVSSFGSILLIYLAITVNNKGFQNRDNVYYY